MKHLFLLFLVFMSSVGIAANVSTISDGDYSDPSIWDGGSTPGSGDNITINDSVNLDANIEPDDLIISNGGVLVTNDYTISLKGNLTVNGDLYAGESIIILESNNSEISSNHSDLTISTLQTDGNNSFINCPLTITNELLVDKCDLVLYDTLTLESTSTQTARIGFIRSNGSVTGPVRVKRYLPYSIRLWSYLCSPVSNSTVGDWQDEILITGDFLNPSEGWTISNNSNPSLYYYDESLNTGDKELDWVNYPVGVHSDSAALVPGRGYSLYIRDNPDRPDYIDVIGEITQGDFTYDMTYTETTTADSLDAEGAPNDGWNLIGNPYPSQVDWDLIDVSRKVNIDNSFYFVDNTSGTWTPRYYADGIGIPEDTKGIIPHSQAIWVRANDTNPSITFYEDDKTSTQGTFYRLAQSNDIVRLYIYADGNKEDELAIRLRSDASECYDGSFDVYKLNFDDVHVFSKDCNKKKLAINNVPEYIDTVDIGFESNSENNEFEFKGVDNLPVNSYLYDKTTNVTTLLCDGTKYSIDSSHEYSIVFDHPIITSHDERTENSVEIYPTLFSNDIFFSKEVSEYVVYDNLGEIVASGTNTDHINTSHLRAGTYHVQIFAGDLPTIAKVIKVE